MTARIERVRTSGTFSLDGQDFDVENNVWIVGDAEEVVVIDAAHDAGPIAETVGDRRVRAIVCTHGHNDHINAAVELQGLTGAAPIHLHPEDGMLWSEVYGSRPFERPLAHCDVLTVAGTALIALHTPGHSPGGVTLYAPVLGVLFSGDTLFKGGPGATGRSFSDFPTIIQSIEKHLLSLPPGTAVLTGHGDDTTIADEAGHLKEWIERGY